MDLYMAPMEGVTGYIYRNTHHAFFSGQDKIIDKYFTPFVVATYTRKLKSRERIDILPENNRGLNGEMHVVPQILTNRSDEMLHMACVMAGMGYREINLNLGCPVRTVTSKGKGSGFLQYPEALSRFLDEVYSELDRKAASGGEALRLSVKTRIGFENPEEAAALMKIFSQFPVSELIIHPRTTKEGYAGFPHVDVFADIFREYAGRMRLIYNGNIFSGHDYALITSLMPSLSGVMLGRGLISDPGLARFIRTGNAITAEELRTFCQALLDAYKEEYLTPGRGSAGEQVLVNRMKELWFYMGNLFSGSRSLVAGTKAPEGEKKPGVYGDFSLHIKNVRKAGNVREYESAVRMLFANCPITGCADGLKDPS